ncbi:hypothetical protein [Endozoicomonas sp.]|uniref:hypothetical protein n=1 Tax=Endozoicomonas sp. TaxID=1892382 RepID=UPI00383AE4AD
MMTVIPVEDPLPSTKRQEKYSSSGSNLPSSKDISSYNLVHKERGSDHRKRSVQYPVTDNSKPRKVPLLDTPLLTLDNDLRRIRATLYLTRCLNGNYLIKLDGYYNSPVLEPTSFPDWLYESQGIDKVTFRTICKRFKDRSIGQEIMSTLNQLDSIKDEDINRDLDENSRITQPLRDIMDRPLSNLPDLQTTTTRGVIVKLYEYSKDCAFGFRSCWLPSIWAIGRNGHNYDTCEKIKTKLLDDIMNGDITLRPVVQGFFYLNVNTAINMLNTHAKEITAQEQGRCPTLSRSLSTISMPPSIEHKVSLLNQLLITTHNDPRKISAILFLTRCLNNKDLQYLGGRFNMPVIKVTSFLDWLYQSNIEENVTFRTICDVFQDSVIGKDIQSKLDQLDRIQNKDVNRDLDENSRISLSLRAIMDLPFSELPSLDIENVIFKLQHIANECSADFRCCWLPCIWAIGRNGYNYETQDQMNRQLVAEIINADITLRPVVQGFFHSNVNTAINMLNTHAKTISEIKELETITASVSNKTTELKQTSVLKSPSREENNQLHDSSLLLEITKSQIPENVDTLQLNKRSVLDLFIFPFDEDPRKIRVIILLNNLFGPKDIQTLDGLYNTPLRGVKTFLELLYQTNNLTPITFHQLLKSMIFLSISEPNKLDIKRQLNKINDENINKDLDNDERISPALKAILDQRISILKDYNGFDTAMTSAKPYANHFSDLRCWLPAILASGLNANHYIDSGISVDQLLCDIYLADITLRPIVEGFFYLDKNYKVDPVDFFNQLAKNIDGAISFNSGSMVRARKKDIPDTDSFPIVKKSKTKANHSWDSSIMPYYSSSRKVNDIKSRAIFLINKTLLKSDLNSLALETGRQKQLQRCENLFDFILDIQPYRMLSFPDVFKSMLHPVQAEELELQIYKLYKIKEDDINKEVDDHKDMSKELKSILDMRLSSLKAYGISETLSKVINKKRMFGSRVIYWLPSLWEAGLNYANYSGDNMQLIVSDILDADITLRPIVKGFLYANEIFIVNIFNNFAKTIEENLQDIEKIEAEITHASETTIELHDHTPTFKKSELFTSPIDAEHNDPRMIRAMFALFRLMSPPDLLMHLNLLLNRPQLEDVKSPADLIFRSRTYLYTFSDLRKKIQAAGYSGLASQFDDVLLELNNIKDEDVNKHLDEHSRLDKSLRKILDRKLCEYEDKGIMAAIIKAGEMTGDYWIDAWLPSIMEVRSNYSSIKGHKHHLYNLIITNGITFRTVIQGFLYSGKITAIYPLNDFAKKMELE